MDRHVGPPDDPFFDFDELEEDAAEAHRRATIARRRHILKREAQRRRFEERQTERQTKIEERCKAMRERAGMQEEDMKHQRQCWQWHNLVLRLLQC